MAENNEQNFRVGDAHDPKGTDPSFSDIGAAFNYIETLPANETRNVVWAIWRWPEAETLFLAVAGEWFKRM
jgi:hypothetical protein